MMRNTQIESQSQAVRRANLPQVAVEPVARKNLLGRRAGTAIQVDLAHAELDRAAEELQPSMFVEGCCSSRRFRYAELNDEKTDPTRTRPLTGAQVPTGSKPTTKVQKKQTAPATKTKEKPATPKAQLIDQYRSTHHPPALAELENAGYIGSEHEMMIAFESDVKFGSMTPEELKKFEQECIQLLCSRDTDKFDSLDYGDEHEDDDDDSFEQAAALNFVHTPGPYADGVIEQHFRKKYKEEEDSAAKARIAKTFYETCLMMAKPELDDLEKKAKELGIQEAVKGQIKHDDTVQTKIDKYRKAIQDMDPSLSNIK